MSLGTVILIATLALAQFPSQTGRPRAQAILGRWRGTSTCVRASWNAACHDEEIRYDFVVSGPDSTRSLLHAAKLVGDGFEPMYDLAFRFSPDSAAWVGEFTNARVHILWSYRIEGDTLVGQVALLPGLQVGRHVVAWRSQQAGPGTDGKPRMRTAPHDAGLLSRP